jgi:hypothetical protein
VIVIDDEPGLVGPRFEILRQELRDDVDLLRRLATCRKPFSEPTPGVWDEVIGCVGEAQGKGRNVC